MKRTLSLLLSVLLVLSTVTCLFTVTTAQAETAAVELISNGDFENTSLNPVGTNFGGIRDTADAATLDNGKWLRATGGLSYATYGDLSAYDAETDTVTKAAATEYAKYFTACSTVIAQPDDATNHIGRAQQTLFQAINIGEGTYAFKFKVKALEATPNIWVCLRGLQSNNETGKVTDSFYEKYTIDVIEASGNFTYDDTSVKGVVITPNTITEWTDVEFIAKVEKIAEPVSSNTAQSILETDFTMLQFYHDAKTLSSAQNGKNYRTTGIYMDDVSIRAYTNPFGAAEFYKDGVKLENTNEAADINYTVNGEETIGVAVGDTVTATVDYNKDGNVFVGWYKGDECVTRDEELTFTVNSTDVYVPKFINKNLLEGTAGSFEGFANAQSLRGTTTDYPAVGEWGTAANAGYLGATTAETVYDVDGNAYTQIANGTRKVTTNAAAIVADAYKGNKSLKLTCSYHSFVTALDVTPNTNYTLTYYIKGTDTDAVKYKTGILTTVNVSTTLSLVPQGENAHAGTAYRYAVADYNPAFTLTRIYDEELVSDTWTKVTLTFNSKIFETLYLGISPGNSEVFWVDELCLVAEEEALATVPVKFADTKGNVIENANLYAEATVMEDFDGSNLLSIDYENESGAYLFAGWYNADNIRLSLDEVYDYEGDLTGVYAKIISKNLLDSSASFEGYENSTSLVVTDNTKYPEQGEWGATKNAGYYGATYEEVIYDKYGKAYQQTASGSVEATTNTTSAVSNQAAYKGNNSLYLSFNSRSIVSGLNVTPNTNYVLTYYILGAAETTMKYLGVSTTVNLSQNNAVTAIDEDAAYAANMKEAIGNLPVPVALVRQQSQVINPNEWIKVTHTFNSGSFEKLYLCLCPPAGTCKAYIDELSLVAEEKPETLDVKFVDKDGNDLSAEEQANVAADAVVETNLIEGTTTASIKYSRGAYTFLGWFDANDKLLGTAENFNVTGSTDGMYAKIRSKNLLTYAASYEGYEVNTELKYTGTDYPSGVYFGGNKNAGYLGQTFAETVYDNCGTAIEQVASGGYAANNISATVSTAYTYTGNKSIYLRNGFWTASMGLDVTPNTDYVLSYYILAPKDVNTEVNTIQLSAIATTLNTGSGSSASGGSNALNQAANLYLDSETITAKHDGKNWVKVTHAFNSMDLSKVYLIIGQTSYSDGSASWAYIDDMTMIETVPTTMNVEMKNCASLDLIDADMHGLYIDQQLSFKVIENIGTAATVTLNGVEVTPSADGVYTVTLAEENTLSVRFEGDENLPNYDEDEFGRKLSENNLDVYSEPVWSGDTVYHETALFTPDKDTVKLLYPVDEIVSLRSYDLATNYIEGYDFEITADGQIKRLEDGRIPVWSTSLITDTKGDWKTNDGRYVVLTGDQTYPKYAISVTYKHSTTFEDGFTPSVPASQYANLNNVMTKLENGEDVNIVIYGDSISCGWSSSGMTPSIKIYDETNTEGNYITRYNINVAPYAPTWVQMLEAKLKELYPNANINIKNLSLGGKSSPWGAENIAARLALWKDEEGNQVVPDLLLTGFGVNDSSAGISTENFKANMAAIIANAREATGNVNMEALMYSPMFPNQSAVNWPAERLLAYEAAMEEIAAADSNAGVYKLSSIFSEIIKNKSCEDYLNTNLNHGNDFTARLYYTGIIASMTADENIKNTVDAPAAPVAEAVTENSVTLTATEGYEYSMDGVTWQTSNVFEGLTESTEYTFYQRIAETEKAYASNASALTVTTASAVIMGDTDGDGKVNLNDLVTLAQYVAKWEGIEETPAMDLDGNGTVDLEDVTYLARHLAGWEGYELN